MTDRLSLYNNALMLIGERALASLSENREPRRHLDTAWNNGLLRGVLEAGQWKFAMRAVALTYSPSVEPDFGFRYAFDKPDDHVRLGGVFSDESMAAPLLHYREEAGFWFSDLETIFIRYVSIRPDYGLDFSLWPQTFIEFVEAALASKVAMPVTQNATKMKDMLGLRKQLLSDALSKDALQDPTRFPPPGNWAKARFAGGASRRGGGYR